MNKEQLIARLHYVAAKRFCLLRMIRMHRLSKRIAALSL